jgi:hypothetical protein
LAVQHTYNPIRELDRPSVGLFNRVAQLTGYALVLHREGQPPAVMRRPEERMTLGEATWATSPKVYWVDVSEHALEIRCRLPADTDASDFSASVHVHCAVDDPLKVVELRIDDVRVALEPRILCVMRAASRGFPVERGADAERAVAEALSARMRTLDFCPGLTVRSISVELR